MARCQAPKSARIWLRSITAVCQSIRPARLSRRSSSRCTAANTPARCHSASRRCAVAGEQPSSRRRCRHAIPVNSTNMIAPKHTRSSTRGRPPRGSGRCSGNSGSITSHNSCGSARPTATPTPPGRRLCRHNPDSPPRPATPPHGGIETASKETQLCSIQGQTTVSTEAGELQEELRNRLKRAAITSPPNG